MSKILRAALEVEVQDGVARTEIEYELFAKGIDLNIFKNLPYEAQEQWSMKMMSPFATLVCLGTMRVRKTIDVTPNVKGIWPTSWVQTSKLFTSEGRSEVSIPTTEEGMNHFREFAKAGMLKNRYKFPIEGTDLVWEIDMYLKPGTTHDQHDYLDWCKIDLEVPDSSVALPEFPFSTTELITNQRGSRTADETALVTDLIDNQFLTSKAEA